jgi:NAD(P)-dependent dehydrogenase (short-subunit alcohol dehydrogenase family)
MATELGEAVVAHSVARQAIVRLAEPDDIARSVLMLAGDEAGWITGQTIMANGGGAFV